MLVVLAAMTPVLIEGTPAEASLTFIPSGDTYVDRSRPTSAYGSSTQLRVSNDPERQTLFKFRVAGIGTGRVQSARLRLYSQKDAPAGGDVFTMSNTSWTEKTVTWNTVPPATGTSPVASLGSVRAGVWYELELGSAITGDGTWGLKMTSPSNTGALYASKEAAGFEPHLIVSVGDAGPPTVPAGLDAAVVGDAYVALSWAESSDDTGVVGYQIWRDDLPAGTVTSRVFSDFGAAPGPHRYRVAALDATGAASAPSDEVTATAPDPGPGPLLLPVHPAIPDDCSADVGAALNEFLAGVRGGSAGAPTTVRFGADRCYRTDSTLMLVGRAYVVVDGNGSTFRTTRRGAVDDNGFSHRQHWRIVSVQNAELRNLHIRGNNTVSDVAGRPELGSSNDFYGNEHGVDIRLSQGIVLRDTTVDGVWGAGVAVDRATNALVTDVTVDRTGTNGAVVLDAHDLIFDRVALLRPRRHGWKIEPEADEWTSGVEIRNSSVCAYTYAFFSSGVKGRANDVWIHDNRITCAKAVAFLVRAQQASSRSGWRFTNNVVENTGTVAGAVFHFDIVENISVNNNVVASPPGAVAVSFERAQGTLEVQSNDFGPAAAVYTIDGRVHGPGVDAWGNTTAAGTDQP